MQDKGKTNEQLIKETKEKYEALIQNIPDAIYSALPDETGTTTFMSPRWEDWTGYVPEDFYRDHETWPKCIHPEDRDKALQAYVEAIKMKREYVAEYRVIHKENGKVRYLRDHGIPIKDENGEVIRLDGIVTDVTVRKQLEDNIRQAQQSLEAQVAIRTAELQAANAELKQEIVIRKQTENALRDTTNFMNNLIESSGDCIIIADPSGCLTRVNNYFLQMLGYEREEEVIGKHITEFGPKEGTNYESVTGEVVYLNKQYFKDRKTMYEKFKKDGRISNWQVYLVTKSGKLVPVEHNLSFLYSEKGDPIATFGITRDITARKIAEKELMEAKEFLENTFRTSLDGIVVVDPQGYITMANEALGYMLGFPQEELVGENMILLTPNGEEHLAKTREFLEAFVEDGYAKEFELKWQRNDGKLIDVEINATLVKDKEGNFIWGVGSVRDITARKRAGEALKKSEEKYHNLIENANDAIVSINTAGMVMGFNKRAEEMFGYSRDEVIGKSSELLVAQQNREKQKEELKRLKEAGAAFDKDQNIFEGIGVRKDGEEFPVEFSYYIVEINGEVIATSSIRDISKRKMAEQKLIDYQKRLKALTSQLTLSEEKERRRFSEYLHDEIGQYLFASQIQLEQLKDSLASGEQTKTLDKVLSNIKQMIDNSRSLTFELSSPILYELGLEKALEWLTEHTCKQYNIHVAFEDDMREKPLDDDMKVLLYQAVRELLTNVAKHAQTQNAGVSVGKVNSNIRITVKDNGVGFNPPNRESSDNQIKGFGLFRITERLEQLGGQLKIESQPNRGTTITIVAPLSVNGVTHEK